MGHWAAECRSAKKNQQKSQEDHKQKQQESHVHPVVEDVANDDLYYNAIAIEDKPNAL